MGIARVNFRRRRRRHTPFLPPPSIQQVRRDNAILIGAGALILLAALLVGANEHLWAKVKAAVLLTAVQTASNVATIAVQAAGTTSLSIGSYHRCAA